MRQKLENFLLKIWYSDAKVPWYLSALSIEFALVRKIRLYSYAKGWLKSTKDSTPIIIVGNISVGGTGKTPLVLFLIDQLRLQGLKVGVISRGYGGEFDNYKPLVLSETSTAQEVGDEPFMIYQRSKIPFAIGKQRVDVAQALKKHHPELDVIISDDGLQHYAMQRTVELLVVDGERGLGNSKLIPAGPLREPLSRIETVDVILSNGFAKHKSLDNLNTIQFDLLPTHFRKLNNPSKLKDFQAFFGQTVHAFAGIGNPERFFKLLESLGIELIRHELGDHAVMPDQFFIEHKNDCVVMTEKDAVKYPHLISDNHWYLPVDVSMQTDLQETLMQVILDKLKEAKL